MTLIPSLSSARRKAVEYLVSRSTIRCFLSRRLDFLDLEDPQVRERRRNCVGVFE